MRMRTTERRVRTGRETSPSRAPVQGPGLSPRCSSERPTRHRTRGLLYRHRGGRRRARRHRETREKERESLTPASHPAPPAPWPPRRPPRGRSHEGRHAGVGAFEMGERESRRRPRLWERVGVGMGDGGVGPGTPAPSPPFPGPCPHPSARSSSSVPAHKQREPQGAVLLGGPRGRRRPLPPHVFPSAPRPLDSPTHSTIARVRGRGCTQMMFVHLCSYIQHKHCARSPELPPAPLPGRRAWPRRPTPT